MVGAHIAATVGMPGWQITLTAIAAALFAATAAVLLDRARMARRPGCYERGLNHSQQRRWAPWPMIGCGP
jgi:hypothetical protein